MFILNNKCYIFKQRFLKQTKKKKKEVQFESIPKTHTHTYIYNSQLCFLEGIQM